MAADEVMGLDNEGEDDPENTDIAGVAVLWGMAVEGGVNDLFILGADSAFGTLCKGKSPTGGTPGIEGELSKLGSLAKNPFRTDNNGLPIFICPAAPAISDSVGLAMPWNAGFMDNGRPGNSDGIILAVLTEAVEVVPENPGNDSDGKESLALAEAYGVEELCSVGMTAGGRPGNTAGLGVDD